VATQARDDRVLPETRALGVFIVPFLLVAFPLLYLFPNDTGNWWAWEIHPSMTALIMGAGYICDGEPSRCTDGSPWRPKATGRGSVSPCEPRPVGVALLRSAGHR
jgi:hypothetical protein